MREILFRAAQKVDGSKSLHWYEGSLVSEKDGYTGEIEYYIENENGSFLVIPETIGQYTGLTDKNGKKIFEGDIVKSCEYDDTYIIRYFDDDNYPAFDCVPEVPLCECNGLAFLVNIVGCEIIGNIHDNLESLKEAEQE